MRQSHRATPRLYFKLFARAFDTEDDRLDAVEVPGRQT
jgi:hypothetical protein